MHRLKQAFTCLLTLIIVFSSGCGISSSSQDSAEDSREISISGSISALNTDLSEVDVEPSSLLKSVNSVVSNRSIANQGIITLYDLSADGALTALDVESLDGETSYTFTIQSPLDKYVLIYELNNQDESKVLIQKSIVQVTDADTSIENIISPESSLSYDLLSDQLFETLESDDLNENLLKNLIDEVTVAAQDLIEGDLASTFSQVKLNNDSSRVGHLDTALEKFRTNFEV
jgi:hypothetical protein